MGKYSLTRLHSKFRKETMPNMNDYEELQRFSEVPVLGSVARSRMRTLEYQENKRYWSDYARNTGINPRYPIRSGVYGSYNSFVGESFEASEAVMSLYHKWKYR